MFDRLLLLLISLYNKTYHVNHMLFTQLKILEKFNSTLVLY